MKSFRLLVSLLVISFSLGVHISKHYYQPQIEVLTKQLDRTQKQLDRTQKQLKKAKQENADKTSRIAELTGNGG